MVERGAGIAEGFKNRVGNADRQVDPCSPAAAVIPCKASLGTEVSSPVRTPCPPPQISQHVTVGFRLPGSRLTAHNDRVAAHKRRPRDSTCGWHELTPDSLRDAKHMGIGALLRILGHIRGVTPQCHGVLIVPAQRAIPGAFHDCLDWMSYAAAV
eukprot:scaffold119138_cov31-Tisochrysis_lutea.AAC.7